MGREYIGDRWAHSLALGILSLEKVEAVVAQWVHLVGVREIWTLLDVS
jgi:hypothetical protein